MAVHTPSSTRHSRISSPPLSTTASSQAWTLGQQPRLNVVTRLAIEGRARQGQEGASIKMYLKLSIPMDSVSPGSTVPLFSEENVKILSSQVHPIDNNSVPYNFSSTTCPLLHNAARALNLPARSPKSYLSVFGINSQSPSSPTSSSRSSVSTNGINVPPLEDKYTGHILISGYNVAFILPKEFPPRFMDNDDSSVRNFSLSKTRRNSISDRNNMHFMAAVDLWVPYLSRPPRAPYLLSIPTPRCLSNNIRLKIFPPNSTNTSSSYASLSSAEEDPGAWELTSDPHVTRAPNRVSRTGSYADFADDESSDSSSRYGFADGCGIMGTFPSAERIRVRWAAPMKNVDIAAGGDGRRRVGVKEVQGEMTCSILGKGTDRSGKEGVAIRVEYKGTCKGVWFPGVATMLGMDVGLEAKGSDVAWVPGEEQKWNVSGGTGYTGFDAGIHSSPVPRQESMDIPQVTISNSSPNGRAPAPVIRQDSSSSAASSASLLRAPLPAAHVSDYSFETLPTSTPTGTVSSISSLPFTSSPEGRSRASSIDDQTATLPAVPLTLHININDILPPAKPVFTFNISGTVLIIPRPRQRLVNGHTSSPPNSDGELDPVPLVLPKFSVLAADTERTTTIIRNEADGVTVEVYNNAGDPRDPQTRKTVIQKGGLARCGSDGGRIALRCAARPSVSMTMKHDQPAERWKTATSSPRSPDVTKSLPFLANNVGQGYQTSSRPKRDGPLMITSVTATLTPLDLDTSLNAYAVRISLPAPTDTESEWLEFGLQHPQSYPGSSTSHNPSNDKKDIQIPRVDVISASVDGVSVRFEMTAAAKRSENTFEKLTSQGMAGEWISWIRVHVGDSGGKVQVDYIVGAEQDEGQHNAKGKNKSRRGLPSLVLLPTFVLPIGCLEVNLQLPADAELLSMHSNLAYQQTSDRVRRLLHYSMEELFHPRLSFVMHSTAGHKSSYGRLTISDFMRTLLWLAPSILFMMLSFTFGPERRHFTHSLERCPSVSDPQWNSPHPTIFETVTITTTIFPTQSDTIWLGSDNLPIETQLSPRSIRKHGDLSSEVSSTASSRLEPSSASIIETSSLLSIKSASLQWPAAVETFHAVRASAQKLAESIRLLWQMFKKLYHYPLDPS